MGHSGGRSKNHPAGQEARRKFTQRERQKIDPPWDELVPRYRLTTRGEKLRKAVDVTLIWGTLFALGMATGLLLAWAMGF